MVSLEERDKELVSTKDIAESIKDEIPEVLNPEKYFKDSDKRYLSRVYNKFPLPMIQDLVVRYAQYEHPSDTARFLTTKYNREITTDEVKKIVLSRKSKDLISNIRAELATLLEIIPIANKFVRINRYDTLYRLAVAENDIRTAADILHKVGKELEGSKVKFEGDVGPNLIAFLSSMDKNAIEGASFNPSKQTFSQYLESIEEAKVVESD